VLELGRVATLDVTERRIGLHDALVTEILERHEVAVLVQAIEPSPTKGERSEILVDHVEKLLGFGQTKGNVTHFRVAHVVARLHVIVDESTAGRAKSFDSVNLILLHANRLTALDNRNRLAGVNAIRSDRVSAQIANRLYLVCFPVELNLVRLHNLLNRFSNVTQANVDSSRLDASVGRIADRLEKLVVLLVEGKRKRAVDDAPVDVSAKINFANIVVAENRLVARIWCIVSSAMVGRASGRKGKTRL